MYLYRYDSLGNLVGSEKLAGGSLVLRTHHSYDTDNRLSAQGWQIGSDSFSQTYNYGEWDGNLSSIVLSRNSSNITVNYTYDGLRRLASMNNGAFTRTYNYATTASGDATTRLSSFTHSGIQSQYIYEWDYSYGYDINGNITSATFGNRTNTYVYDANNQLIRENNDRLQYTQTWVYDAFGNITSTSKYPYTTGELGTPTSTVNYGYTDSNWGDLLTTYNGHTIEYDEIGNPLTVTDSEGNVVESFTWTQGRQLASLTSNGVTWEYTYDADGLRTGRTDGTNTYQYIYAGDKLVRMIYNGEVVDISYAGSQPLSLTYDGATYYYVLNGQGDVIGLTNSSGKMVIGYTFGAYGVATGLVADPELSYVLVQMNPLTYRGYVYDRETKFFYLQSRYYDPELGRFINADAFASTGQGILGNNMFAYCGNNPATTVDPSGNAWCKISFDAFSPFDSSAVPMAGGGGGFMGAVFAMNSADSEIDQAIDEFDRYVNNTSEATVLNADYYAFYKGALVIKLPLTGIFDGASASFGIIIMDNDLGYDDNAVNLLRHEYGHFQHLLDIGLPAYITTVAIPSASFYLLKELDVYHGHYYSLPWEYIADRYGGATRSLYSSGADVYANIYWVYSYIVGVAL